MKKQLSALDEMMYDKLVIRSSYNYLSFYHNLKTFGCMAILGVEYY